MRFLSIIAHQLELDIDNHPRCLEIGIKRCDFFMVSGLSFTVYIIVIGGLYDY